MSAFVSFSYVFWFWTLAAAAIGAMTGIAVETESRGDTRRISLLHLGLIFVAAGLIVIPSHFLIGSIEIYLTTGVYFGLVFVVTMLAGTFAVKRRFELYRGWAWGLIPLVLVWLIATTSWLPLWQAETKAEIEALARAARLDASDVSLSGRDVLLTPREAGNAWLVGEAARLAGVRYVLAPKIDASAPLASPSAGVPASPSVVESAPTAYAEPIPTQSAPSVSAAPPMDRPASAQETVQSTAQAPGVRHFHSHRRHSERH